MSKGTSKETLLANHEIVTLAGHEGVRGTHSHIVKIGKKLKLLRAARNAYLLINPFPYWPGSKP